MEKIIIASFGIFFKQETMMYLKFENFKAGRLPKPAIDSVFLRQLCTSIFSTLAHCVCVCVCVRVSGFFFYCMNKINWTVNITMSKNISKFTCTANLNKVDFSLFTAKPSHNHKFHWSKIWFQLLIESYDIFIMYVRIFLCTGDKLYTCM